VFFQKVSIGLVGWLAFLLDFLKKKSTFSKSLDWFSGKISFFTRLFEKEKHFFKKSR